MPVPRLIGEFELPVMGGDKLKGQQRLKATGAETYITSTSHEHPQTLFTTIIMKQSARTNTAWDPVLLISQASRVYPHIYWIY